jgi:ParB family chromosome partitioning protein
MNTAKKSPLGRGLGALIDGVEKEALEKKVEANLQIDINSIDGNPFQPRTRFDSETLEELAASIRQVAFSSSPANGACVPPAWPD